MLPWPCDRSDRQMLRQPRMQDALSMAMQNVLSSTKMALFARMSVRQHGGKNKSAQILGLTCRSARNGFSRMVLTTLWSSSIPFTRAVPSQCGECGYRSMVVVAHAKNLTFPFHLLSFTARQRSGRAQTRVRIERHYRFAEPLADLRSLQDRSRHVHRSDMPLGWNCGGGDASPWGNSYLQEVSCGQRRSLNWFPSIYPSTCYSRH